MKARVSFVVMLATAAAALAIASAGKAFPYKSGDDKTGQQPVVVELFTSEGCSSCPPADALLMKLQASQPIHGANIIAIEEHVDYWNHDGWTDPYSSADWTQRQQDYVVRFKQTEPYTPQMVVDGETQMVGGQAIQAQQAIQHAAAQPKTDVSLTAETSSGDSGQYKVRVGKLDGNTDRDTAEIWLAVSESGLGSSVKAGENAGKNLQHAPVLRSLKKIGVASPKGDTSFDGTAKVKFNRDWKRQNLQVAVFVQEKKSMKILGAAALPVSN
jgi:hypothetical protein